MIRCITLFQPIATLVWEGIKTVETRGYPTKVRGELLIHSAQAIPPAGFIEKYLADPVFRFYLFGGHRMSAERAWDQIKYNLDRFPRGVIGGKVTLTDCRHSDDPRLRVDLGALSWRREKALGNLASTPDEPRFAWLTRDPERFPAPIRAKGSQGFWDASEFFDIVGPIATPKP